MRAIGVTTYGGPRALHELDVPAEPLGPGQVRVRVSASAVSPTDTMVRSGGRAGGRERAEGHGDVPGMDVAGEVTEVGDGVDHVAVGDRVMAVVLPSGSHGAYRSELVLPGGSVVTAPRGSSDAAASTLPMNGLTALAALDHLGLQPGQVLAVTGAAGAFGGYLVQLANARGLTVVADAKPEDADSVASFGAVVVPRSDDFAAAVRERFPDGVDALADGALLAEAALGAVKDGGGVVTVRGWGGPEGGERGLRFFPVMVFDHVERRDWLEELRSAAETGAVTLRVADVLPAADAAQAHERLEAGGVRGRIVLDWAA